MNTVQVITPSSSNDPQADKFLNELNEWVNVPAAFQYVVGGENPTYNTIQEAVDAAEMAGEKASIMILPGTYEEDVLISKTGISMMGQTLWATEQTSIRSITYDTIETTVGALQGLYITEQLKITGGNITQIWVNSCAVVNNSANSPVLLDNTHGTSRLVAQQFRAVQNNDSAPALDRSGNVGLEFDVVELVRGDTSTGSKEIVANIQGGGLALCRNTRFRGQVRRAGGAMTIAGCASSIDTLSNGSACLDITGGGQAFLLGVQLHVGDGGPAWVADNGFSAFFANVVSTPGTHINSTMGVNFATDGVALKSDPNMANQFLSGDGSYKDPTVVEGDDGNNYRLKVIVLNGGNTEVIADPV